jgi:hypothetical protein
MLLAVWGSTPFFNTLKKVIDKILAKFIKLIYTKENKQKGEL